MSNTKQMEVITTKIIEALDKGRIPWECPYSESLCYARSFITKNSYSFANQMLLFAQTGKMGGEWLTFNQINERKYHLRKGSHGGMITFWKPVKKQEENEENEENKENENEELKETKKTFAILKSYFVFSSSDVDGILPEEILSQKTEYIDAMEAIKAYTEKHNILLHTAKDIPHFSPSKNEVVVPPKSDFKHENAYWKTLFHEIIHSTQKAMNRELEYAEEELVADMGSCYLMNLCGMPIEARTEQETIAYCSDWASKLNEKKNLFIHAASLAEKAAKLVLGAEC